MGRKVQSLRRNRETQARRVRKGERAPLWFVLWNREAKTNRSDADRIQEIATQSKESTELGDHRGNLTSSPEQA